MDSEPHKMLGKTTPCLYLYAFLLQDGHESIAQFSNLVLNLALTVWHFNDPKIALGA